VPVSPSTSIVNPIRTAWFGMRCQFTQRAMAGALESGGVQPAVVVLPRAPRPHGSGWPEPPFDRWVREKGATIVEVDRLSGVDLRLVLREVEAHGVVLGVGACFPWKIPASVRAALRGGVLNIHPSLLPSLRGPDPVFHTYRDGLEVTGVTVHLMDDGWDSGPILARESIPVPDDGRMEDLEASLAHMGGRLLGRVASPWCAGVVEPIVQDESLASWAPIPSERDRLIPTGLTVSQASRFVRACGPLRAPDPITGSPVTVDTVIAPDSPDFEAFRDAGRLVRVRCLDGDLWLLRHGRQAVVDVGDVTI